MNKQIKTAKVFDLAYIGQAEVNEGSGDCLALGIGSYGDTIAVVEDYASQALSMLQMAMDDNPQGYVSIVTLTGEAIQERAEIDRLSAMAGRHIDLAIKGIYSVRFLDADENRVNVKNSRRGDTQVSSEPRFRLEVSTDFYCISCRNTGKQDCRRKINASAMDEILMDGRTMTIADCPECGNIMTRAGSMKIRRETHGGLSERKLVFEAPETAHCFSCKQQNRMIWARSVRKSDDQPRPSYRGNCVRCLGMVGRPWTHTKMVPVKRQTLEKLVNTAKEAEDALYQRRMAEAQRRRSELSESEIRNRIA